MQSSKKIIALIIMVTNYSMICMQESPIQRQDSQFIIEHKESDPLKILKTISGSLHDISLEDTQESTDKISQSTTKPQSRFLSCFDCCIQKNEAAYQQQINSVVK
jgi:uncharacterized membrane-anchored protein